jgi:hypothetical protein
MKRTARTSFLNVTVDQTNGEFLRFRIDAKGAIPTFTFLSRHGVFFNASDFSGHPKSSYQRRFPLATDQLGAKKAVYSLTFGFLGAPAYTLLVELRDASNALVKTVKDIDYDREDQTDVFSELFKIAVQ